METASVETQQESALRTLITNRAQALASKNVEASLTYFSKDLVQFSLAPPLQIPVKEALDEQALQAWFDTFEGSLGYEVHQLKLTVGEDIAFSHCFIKMSAVSKPTNEPFEFWFRLTMGFCKSGDQWQITHEHESVPFYMDGSFLAATDLTPQ